MNDTAKAIKLTLQSIREARAANQYRDREASSDMNMLATEEMHREALALMSLKWIGEQLHKQGGTELMRQTLRGASMSLQDFAIVSGAWAGIGEWHG
jgi:hypothetical protein